jgi:drug/metabolite transporter (DMT)-like permease
MRKPTSVEIMLLSAIALWALNLTVTRYILTHGFQPLAYSTVRYLLAAVLFVAITLAVEGSLRIARRDIGLVIAAGTALFVNQIGFVYSLKTTSASVIALILAATPIFAALFGLALGTELLPSRFWIGAALSFLGVGLVALGAGGELRGDVGGILLGIMTAATWAVYSMLIAPLLRRYSPSRISAVVLFVAWLPVALIGSGQTADQDWRLGWEVWVLLVFATLGPLVITNVLWFRSLDRIGPSRATLATNLQPFVAALFAVVLLNERINAGQVAGGLLIGLGILAARGRQVAPQVE